jgi:nucleoside-diphosphate-sugar epimerase
MKEAPWSMKNHQKKGTRLMKKTLFITGAAGFIGHETAKEAVKAGWQVTALVHSVKSAEALRGIGARPVAGDVHQPLTWMAEAQDATAFIDLVQPELPQHLGHKEIEALSAERADRTRRLLDALRSLPAEQRPLFIAVSRADDLQPDAHNIIRHDSALRAHPRGFGHMGIPTRQLIEASGLDATYVYFGNLVYGPGKVFAEQYVAALTQGTAHVIGDGTNRLPMVHVTDAARALVHLATLARANTRVDGMAALAVTNVVGRTFLVMDGADTSQRMLLDATADAMGVKRPGSVPAWVAAHVAGSIRVESMTLDVHAENSALRKTGFSFTYPSYREGVPATLAQLGSPSVVASAA